MKLYFYILILFAFLFSEAELFSNKDIFLVGEHIEAHFNELDSYGSDWIGIFLSGTSNEDYLYWQFTNGTQDNNYNFIDSGYINFAPMSLPQGEYELRLFYNNNYELISSYPFTIIDSCIEPPLSSYNGTFNVMSKLLFIKSVILLFVSFIIFNTSSISSGCTSTTIESCTVFTTHDL